MVTLFIRITLLGILFLTAFTASSTIRKNQLINWQGWDKHSFSQAQLQNKLILLNLEAVWCHWCHVMDKKTYANQKIADLIQAHFIPIKVDQDSRPDLALKYKDYGWPATIFLDSEGKDIVKRAGFISPDRMLALLTAIVADPSPENTNFISATEDEVVTSSLSLDLKNQLIENHATSLDQKQGGLKIFQKYVDIDSMEFALTRILEGNKTDLEWIIKTLDNALALQDSEWGGFYQYSTHGDWQHPHFEKIIKFQSRYVRIYAYAYSILGDKRYLQAAINTANYMTNFLTAPNGAFYVSQDADLIQGEHSEDYFNLNNTQRLKLGIPKIDENIYARENGWAIEAFAFLYEVTLEIKYLNAAKRAMLIIENGWKNSKGGFTHQEIISDDVYSSYLADNTAIGKAYLQLYRSTANRVFLDRAISVGDYIQENFYIETGSFRLATSDGTPVTYPPQVNESISAARLFSMLFHVTGQTKFLESAKHAMKFLTKPSIALANITEEGILLADHEINQLPLHITIVGSKRSGKSTELFSAGLVSPSINKRIEWWDRTEGKLMNDDVKYPYLDQPKAFVCTNKICSLPIATGEELKKFVRSKLSLNDFKNDQ